MLCTTVTIEFLAEMIDEMNEKAENKINKKIWEFSHEQNRRLETCSCFVCSFFHRTTVSPT